jgi:hypothetical protein
MNKCQGIAFRNKLPIFCETINDKITAYDGKNYYDITKEQKDEIRSLKTDYILIEKNKDRDRKKVKRGKWEEMSLKELYDNFIRDADELYKQTKGVVNMYRTGRDSQTAIYLAYQFLNNNNIKAEPITAKEYTWITKASHGAIIFGYEYAGPIYQYDLNSAYPSIYSSVNFLVPIKQGEFQHLTKETFEAFKFYCNGIYRVKIEYPNNDNKWKKLFRLNYDNYYTNIDLTYAKKIGLKITLLDEPENLLAYPRNKCKTGHELFNDYVKLLYPLRKNPIIKDRCKALLRCLWGALSCEQVQKFRFKIDEEFELFPTKEAISLCPYSDNEYEVTTIKKNQPFETNYARMKPFLLAAGRVKIAKQIEPHVEHIYRCHTDSTYSDIELPIECSLELGEMKYEGCIEHGKIVNATKVIDFSEE